jgi:hypothetical protein
MILMRHRRPEQRKDAVAGGLHDVAVVAVDGVHHQLESGIDDSARFLGVEVLHQLHRALDVGEQRRHRLALAFDRVSGVALGIEVDDGARRRGGRWLSTCLGGRAYCAGALSTEARIRRIVKAAL